MITDIPDDFICGFLKYHPIEYLESFQNGILHCNSIQNFTKLDPLDGRGDKYEYVVKQTFGKSAVLDLIHGDLAVTHIEGIRIREDYYQYNYYNRDFYANLFCLYAITTKNPKPVNPNELPERLMQMGTHVLVIYNSIEFVTRVKKALTKSNLEYQMRLVEYLDLYNHEGSKSFFQKPLRYSYQQEYRIMIKNTCEQVLKLDIGSIKDISEILPSEKLKRTKVIYY